MRQKDLVEQMDASEILEWWAFDLLNDDEFKGRMMKEINLENQRNQTAEQEAQRVVNMFRRFGMKNKKEK